MSISFACNKCGKRYSVKDAFAGKKVKCSACGTTMTLPAAGEKSTAAAPASSTAKPAAKPASRQPPSKSKPAPAAKASGDEYELDAESAPLERPEVPTMAGHILQPKVDPDEIDDLELEPPSETKMDVGVFLDDDPGVAGPPASGKKAGKAKAKPASASSSLGADDLTVAEDPKEEPPPPEPKIACPGCGEQIKQSSVLCVHCGLNLRTGEKVEGASKKGGFGKLFGGRRKEK